MKTVHLHIHTYPCKMHKDLLLSRAPLVAPGLETGNVCMLPVWDTGQLILHCQHSSIHNEDLIWWIKVWMHYCDTLCTFEQLNCESCIFFSLSLQDGIPTHVNSESLVIHVNSSYQAEYQCMVQHGTEILSSSLLQLDIRYGVYIHRTVFTFYFIWQCMLYNQLRVSPWT